MQTRNGLIVFDLNKLKTNCTECLAILKGKNTTTSFATLIDYLTRLEKICNKDCDTEAREKDLVSLGAVLKCVFNKILNSNRKKSLVNFFTSNPLENTLRELYNQAFHHDLEFLSDIAEINKIALYKIYEPIDEGEEKHQPATPRSQPMLGEPAQLDTALLDSKQSPIPNKLMTRGGLVLLDGDEFKKVCDNQNSTIGGHQKIDDTANQLHSLLKDMIMACTNLSKTLNTKINDQERQNYEYQCLREGVRLKGKLDTIKSKAQRKSFVGNMNTSLVNYEQFHRPLKILESLKSKNEWPNSTAQVSPRSQIKTNSPRNLPRQGQLL